MYVVCTTVPVYEHENMFCVLCLFVPLGIWTISCAFVQLYILVPMFSCAFLCPCSAVHSCAYVQLYIPVPESACASVPDSNLYLTVHPYCHRP
jgi:hypothetical protein